MCSAGKEIPILLVTGHILDAIWFWLCAVISILGIFIHIWTWCTRSERVRHVSSSHWCLLSVYLVIIHMSLPCTRVFSCLCLSYLYFTPLSLSHLSVHPCFHHYLCRSFCFGHVSRLQRFEGFRNEKTMPQSLEPSCSGATEEGPVTTNHLRLVPGTHVAVWPAKSKCYHPSTLSRQFSQTELLETSTAVELSMYFNWTAFKTKTASVLAPFHI